MSGRQRPAIPCPMIQEMEGYRRDRGVLQRWAGTVGMEVQHRGNGSFPQNYQKNGLRQSLLYNINTGNFEPLLWRLKIWNW